MNALDFITDINLRKTIEDCIEYVYVLFDKSKEETNDLFKRETHRIIILYVISIIEAVLFFIYKKRGEKIYKIDYKFITNLPNKFNHSDDANNSPIIVAVQKKISKQESEIGLVELVNFLKEKNIILEKTANQILEINGMRNTFHLNKSRSDKDCDIKYVESALALLVYIIEKAPKGLKIKEN